MFWFFKYGFSIVILIIFMRIEKSVNTELFTAAVVNYTPLRPKTESVVSVIKRNTEEYVKIIETIKKEGADIIIFPEGGLTTEEYVDQQSLHIYSKTISQNFVNKSLCDGVNSAESDDELAMLSCAAKNNHIFVILSLIECENDAFYSTTIVFDFDGKLVKKIRQMNLLEIKVEPRVEQNSISSKSLETPFGNFIILHDIAELYKTNQSNEINYILIGSLYRPKENLPEIPQAIGFGANGYNVLLSSYFKPDKKYAKSIIAQYDGVTLLPCTSKNYITADIARNPKSGKGQKELKERKACEGPQNDRRKRIPIQGKSSGAIKSTFTAINNITDFMCNISVTNNSNFKQSKGMILYGTEHFYFCGIYSLENQMDDCNHLKNINISLNSNINDSSRIYIPLIVCQESLSRFKYKTENSVHQLIGTDLTCDVDCEGPAIIGISTRINAFKAAIVEYKVDESEKGALQIISKNIAAYVELMEQLEKVDIDIAVFPEYGITGRVEDPTDYAIPIPEVSDEDPNFDDLNLKTLSNAAKSNKMYIVINLLEKTANKSSKNTESNTEYFNTNVVFNKQGKLVAKYRKINTFHESKLTKGTEPCTFKADDLGGAVFGLFTSQDILFENPSISITKNEGLTAILYPNAWPITLPFYNPISIQHSYVKKTKVPLIGSNLNNVEFGYSGSVIIAGDSTFSIKRLTGISGTNIQAADMSSSLSSFGSIVIPSSPGKSRSLPTTGNNDLLDRSKLGVDKEYNSKKYKIKNLDLSEKTIDEKQCSGEFCCTLKATLNSTSSSAVYKLIVYKGKDTTILNEERNVKYCVLLSCENDLCGYSTDVQALGFTTVEISATFDETDNPLPVSLVTDYDVVNETVYTVSDSTKNVFKTSKDVSNLNVFGFVSTGSGANSIQVSFVFMIVGFILHYVLKH